MNPWNTGPAQAGHRIRPFFEGWYFKQVSRDHSQTWSIIPGISHGRFAIDDRAFIQLIEGKSGATWWFEFPAGAYSSSSRRLDIEVGASRFSSEGIELSLSDGRDVFNAKISFGSFAELPLRFFSPGVMGPYSFVPFMECNHGLISLDHELSGWFEKNGRRHSFDGGRGYVEKDWGRSMPRSWIWTQSNNFPVRGDSFMFSIARIPWLGASFNGFLCVGRLGGEIFREASWTGAAIRRLIVADDRVELALKRGRLDIEARIERSRGGLLRAPIDGVLSRRISESVDAILDLRVSEAGMKRFEGRAINAGLEVVGDAKNLAE